MQLAGGMQVQRQVGQIVQADDQPNDENHRYGNPQRQPRALEQYFGWVGFFKNSSHRLSQAPFWKRRLRRAKYQARTRCGLNSRLAAAISHTVCLGQNDAGRLPQSAQVGP